MPSITKFRYVVAWSGGVTSAWCGGWALRNFPKTSVDFLWHDTKEEDEDTYRFSKQMAVALCHPITERSDGRSVTELMYDENMLANNRAAFCSRILKGRQRDLYLAELKSAGYTCVVLLLGLGKHERRRIQLATAYARAAGYTVRFPVAEAGVTKQQTADWCKSLGVCLPRMYEWSEHANCVGCVRGGQQYWLAVDRNHPEVFQSRSDMEEEFGHTFIPEISLRRLRYEGRDIKIRRKERIEIGSCECGD